MPQRVGRVYEPEAPVCCQRLHVAVPLVPELPGEPVEEDPQPRGEVLGAWLRVRGVMMCGMSSGAAFAPTRG